jgi:thiol-disulfide isomerase/thioredoxin
MQSKRVSVGHTIPYNILADTAGKSVSVSFENNRYTLVDIWYSNCAPCIKQFPELLSLYDRYQSKGFGIVQISTDVEARRGSMIKLINQYKLNWPHYWEKNGIKTSGFFINQFPTKFLVDNRGIIIEKNLGMASLQKYLESVLHNS